MGQLADSFHPLVARCAAEALWRLPKAEREDLYAEARCFFLSLLCEFDSERGVPFLAYVNHKLPRRMSNFVREQLRRRLRLETSLEDFGEEDPNLADRVPPTVVIEDGFRKALFNLFWKQVSRDLTPQQRQVTRLKLQGVTEREIADRLCLSQPMVNRLWKEAVQILERHWNDTQPAPPDIPSEEKNFPGGYQKHPSVNYTDW